MNLPKKLLRTNFGFTLVELLVVMAILSSLVALVAGGYRSAQTRGTDAQRKADLRELANALELFYEDYKQYPPESNENVTACPWDFTTSTGTECVWGESEMTDGKTSYFKVLPEDPDSGQNYVYKIVSGSNNQKFQLFARLENPEDIDCLNDDCANPGVTITCGGSSLCNFAVTSSNTDATE